MPALNVDFTDAELATLRQIALERGGIPLKQLVRDATASDIQRHRALQEGAAEFKRFFNSAEQEFAAAFPDDERPRQSTA